MSNAFSVIRQIYVKGKATMYTPKDFRVTDQEQISSFMQTHNFAALVSWDGKRPIASHLLFEVATKTPSGLPEQCTQVYAGSKTANVWKENLLFSHGE
jgi:hypothetical protein